MKIKLAISTCPNDTFAFHGLLQRKIDWRGIDFEIQLLDIQELNEGLLQRKIDVAKASFHAALVLADSTVVLPSGAALGFGVGPLLLAAEDQTDPDDADLPTKITLCPGELTTATLLYRLFYADSIASGKTVVQQVLFSDIMPALQQRRGNFGVCIHEGRFTWQQQGLHCVNDLGARWEQQTDSPLPLGGILAQRRLPREVIAEVQTLIRQSIEYGLSNREETLSTMQQYAQELSDEVLWQHVDLYVNPWTVEMGETGRQALDQLAKYARQAGLVLSDGRQLEVFR